MSEDMNKQEEFVVNNSARNEIHEVIDDPSRNVKEIIIGEDGKRTISFMKIEDAIMTKLKIIERIAGEQSEDDMLYDFAQGKTPHTFTVKRRYKGSEFRYEYR